MSARFRELGWRRVIAFQTCEPLHRADVELTWQAVRASGTKLPLHPAVGGGAAGRYRPLHPGAQLRDRAVALPSRDHDAEPAQLGDAHGRAPGGGVERDHQQEPRMHPLHRRARLQGGRRRAEWPAVLRALRRADAAGEARAGARDRHGSVPGNGLREESGPVRADWSAAARRPGAQAERRRVEAAPRARVEPPRLVHVPRGGGRASPGVPAAPPPGLRGAVHRAFRRRQVDARQRARGDAARARRAGGR